VNKNSLIILNRDAHANDLSANSEGSGCRQARSQRQSEHRIPGPCRSFVGAIIDWLHEPELSVGDPDARQNVTHPAKTGMHKKVL